MKKRKKCAENKRGQTGRASELLPGVTHPDAAGIDVGAEELVVAVDPQKTAEAVRTFGSYTGELHALRDWLLSCGVKTVAMESTGNYWIAAYQILEDAGIEVCLVNAKYVKGVPGKKTDVCDAQWLQQLHRAGLLRKSFRPHRQIVPIRYLTRHRASLVEASSQMLLHMQKVLTEMNLKLTQVLSDIDGKSALAIIEAIVAGERDREKLARLCDRRCRSTREERMAALEGDYREEYIFVLGQCLERWQRTQADLEKVDAKLQELLAALHEQGAASAEFARKPHHKRHKNCPSFEVFREAWHFYGVDLAAIDGVSAGLLTVLMSELGTGEQICAAFGSSGAFASWLGLCPDNRISGGRVLRAKTRSVKNRVANALRLAAFGLSNSKSKLGEFARRMKARLGKAEGITATAHKLARIIYSMIKTRASFDPQKAFAESPVNRTKRVKRLRSLAERLGFAVVENQPLAA